MSVNPMKQGVEMVRCLKDIFKEAHIEGVNFYSDCIDICVSTFDDVEEVARVYNREMRASEWGLTKTLISIEVEVEPGLKVHSLETARDIDTIDERIALFNKEELQ